MAMLVPTPPIEDVHEEKEMTALFDPGSAQTAPSPQSSLVWSNITYDIPLGKKNKKLSEEEQGQKHRADDVEMGLARPDDEQAVPLAEGHRRILSGVGGSVKQGEMVAILGASGAGKTTLLNILSARLSSVGNLHGEVLFHNRLRDSHTWKRTVGFVEQDDIMLPLLTVQETLEYAARMRLPDKLYSQEQKLKRVQDTIEMLRLQKCKDTRIGSATTRGVSGGERKRASIGMELVSDASLLLLDEPTSGLDAYAAYSVIENLHNTTRKRGLSCLMTIHQPSWALLSLIDRVQLLAQGKVYYEGKPRDMKAWFESIGYKVPEGANPADYYITIAENPEQSQEGDKRVTQMIQAWSNQATSTRNSVQLNEVGKVTSDDKSLEAYRVWPSSWISELSTLTRRNATQWSRDRATLFGTLGQTVVILILVGFAFFRLGRSQADVLSRIGVLFFLVINTQFSVVFPVLTPFPLQRSVMKRERSAGTYRSSTFYLAKLLIELPSNVLAKAPFFVIFYWMVGLRATADAFFIYFGIGSLLVVVSVCLGLFIGSISPTIELANILTPMISIIFLLFGGNLLPSPPPWFIWLHYISPLTYSYSALAQNEFKGETFNCSSDTSSQCYATGQQVLQQYHLTTFDIGGCTGFLVAIAFALALAGYLGIRFTAHPKFRYS